MTSMGLHKAIFAVLALALVSACAKTPSNPFRHSSAYSAIPYQHQQEPQVLANGELHYN